MRFHFIRCPTIPRLAWCADLRGGSGVATIYHGPWLETRDTWFVEGAWTGDFENGDMDSALFAVGTSGVLRDGRAIFSTPTDVIGRIHSYSLDDRLFLSNSMTFLLAMAGDEPDPCYPFYRCTLREYQEGGISRADKWLPTMRGHRVQLHQYCQIAVDDRLNVTRIEKPTFPRPGSFEEYVAMLRGLLSKVLENAASPSRRCHRYSGMATLSGGYDSNALAALVSTLGVRDAVTLRDEVSGHDSGEVVGRSLGMNVRVASMTDFETTPGLDESEFFSWPDRVSGISFAPFERDFIGRIVMFGQWGDKVFGLDAPDKYREFRNSPFGTGRLVEFRLRTGFLDFNPLFAWGLELASLRAIALSEEMQPWRVGGGYDRPIARRILESAGVPRGAFGRGKAYAPRHRFRSTRDMSAAARADYHSYRRDMPRATVVRFAWYKMLTAFRAAGESIAAFIRRRVSKRLGAAIERCIPVPWRYRRWDELDFTMHWGHARVKRRYAEAVAVVLLS